MTSAATRTGAGARRPRIRAPEPSFLWIRFAPRRWPPPDLPWTDLSRGGLGARPGDRGTGDAGEPLPDLAGAPFDDVIWLPPVPAARRAERAQLALGHLRAGTPVLVQRLAVEEPPEPALVEAGAVVLHDLLPALLAGDLDGLATLPAGSAAVWPLVPGRTDDPDLWQRGCGALAAAGVAVVQSTVPRLVPADRRRLAEGADGDAFDRLFHAPEPDERAFARVAAAAGLDPFLPRPLPRPPATGQEARRIAAAVFLVAELWLRLGRTPSRGQAYFRAARWIDEAGYDPAALAREGNLGVVEVIGDAERELIEDAVATAGRPALLESLLEEYVGDAP